MTETASLFQEKRLECRTDQFLDVTWSSCAHLRLFINKKKTKTIKPEKLNHFHIEFVSLKYHLISGCYWALWFILYFILHLLSPLPTLTFISFISNCTTTAIQSDIKPVDVKTAISTVGTETGSGQSSCSAAKPSSYVENSEHMLSAIQSTLTQPD